MRILGTAIGILLLWAGTVLAFTDNGDGTVTDSRTGLVWQKQDDGTTKTWKNAITYCEGLTLGGQSDWRLPNVKELKTIVDNSKKFLAIDTTYFPNTQGSYWSSSSFASSSNFAWFVHFSNGYVNELQKTNTYYVRCVRGGQ
jgi:hypothetical protein